MSKALLSLLAAALVCVAGTNAVASDEISTTTLSSMGLSGLQVMTDSQALEVRGMGYVGSRDSYRNRHDSHKKQAEKPWAAANGKSWASVELGGRHSSEEAGAGSQNSYAAEGKYFAGGQNYSEAALSTTDVLRVDYPDGTFSAETKIRAISVSAGGFSNASAF